MAVYVARVESLRMDEDGQVLFTASDNNNNTYFPCTTTSSFGGGDGRGSQSCLQVGTEVVLIATGEGIYARYYAVAYIPHPNDSLAVNCDGVQSIIEYEFSEGRDQRSDPDVQPARVPYLRNTDYDGVHLEDIQLEVQDSLVNISTLHGLTLQGIPRVSVQIPADAETACFRVSADGTANNAVLNAVPHLDRLFTYLGQLEAKVLALETALAASMTAQAATLTEAAAVKNAAVPGSGAADAANATAVTNAQTALSSVPAPGPATTVREDSNQDVNSYVIIP